MKLETEILRRAERMLPLMRSITTEAQARTREIQRLESDLERLHAGPGEPIHEIRRTESELFQHRREMENIKKELVRLGCSLDEAHPERIIWLKDDNEVSFDAPRLDETGYRPDRASPRE